MDDLRKDIDAAGRARWLAELCDALDAADRLASGLSLARIHSEEAVELFSRLAAARAQMKALRLGRPDEDFGDAGPKWSNPPLWPLERADEP